MPTLKNLARAAVAAAALAALTACSSPSGAPGASPSAAPAAPIRVYAAASLQQLFTDLGQQFKTETGVPVELTFGGSADLLTQLTNGAPGDVLITADEATMTKAEAAKLIAGQPKIVATNTLVIAVQPGNPKKITSYADLTKPGITVVRCAPQVPCGAATQKVEQASHITTKPVSEENSVTDVLNKVTSGQADAGIVYGTDVARSNGKAEAVEFPEAKDAVNRYPIATLAGSKEQEQGTKFVDFIAGPKGQEAFAKAGFGKP